MLKLYKIHLDFHTKQQRRNVPDQKMQQNKNRWGKNVYASHLNAYRPSVQTSKQGLQMSNQPRHQLNSSSNSKQRLMRCKYCDKQFARLSSLNKHQMLHESIEGRTSDDLMRNRSLSRSSNEFVHQSSSSAISKPGSLTLTPSLLSNLNKLANLNSTTDGRDGKKPAILININTNDAMKEEIPNKLQELPIGGGASGLMISSVISNDKKHYETERNFNKSTVMIQNGKKAVSLSDLQCPICKKIVSQPFSLKIHLRTHTMER